MKPQTRRLANELTDNSSFKLVPLISQEQLKDLLVRTEIVLGENLQWIRDNADLRVRHGDAETLRRLKQLDQGWKEIVRAIARLEMRPYCTCREDATEPSRNCHIHNGA